MVQGVDFRTGKVKSNGVWKMEAVKQTASISAENGCDFRL